jgi:hypothetical protein
VTVRPALHAVAVGNGLARPFNLRWLEGVAANLAEGHGRVRRRQRDRCSRRRGVADDVREAEPTPDTTCSLRGRGTGAQLHVTVNEAQDHGHARFAGHQETSMSTTLTPPATAEFGAVDR